jgi:predicted dehydrogenase
MPFAVDCRVCRKLSNLLGGGNLRSTMFRVGVIGATGFIGTPYRREIRDSADQARLTCLCARRRDLLEAAGALDGVSALTDDWHDVVNHPDVDTVLVATPDALHHEAVMACAAGHKHVICEKPVGANVGEAWAMWSAYREIGLAHFVPFWTRYHPLFAKAKQVVQQGTLGDVRVIVYRWHNPRPRSMPLTWRDDAALSSAGSIADVGSHAYDTIRWILGCEATRVLAHGDVVSPEKPDLGRVNLKEALDWGGTHDVSESNSTRKGTAFDFASISFELENGAAAAMIVSHAFFLRKGLAPELELHGDEASLAVDRVHGRVTLLRADGMAEVVHSLAAEENVNRFAQHVFPGMAAMIAGAPTDHPNLEDGYRVQLFTDAAATSARTGAWVELSAIDPAAGGASGRA